MQEWATGSGKGLRPVHRVRMGENDENQFFSRVRMGEDMDKNHFFSRKLGTESANSRGLFWTSFWWK